MSIILSSNFWSLLLHISQYDFRHYLYIILCFSWSVFDSIIVLFYISFVLTFFPHFLPSLIVLASISSQFFCYSSSICSFLPFPSISHFKMGEYCPSLINKLLVIYAQFRADNYFHFLFFLSLDFMSYLFTFSFKYCSVLHTNELVKLLQAYWSNLL